MKKVKSDASGKPEKKVNKRKKFLTVTLPILVILAVFVSGIAFNWFGAYSRIVRDAFGIGVDYIDLEHPLEKVKWKTIRADAEGTDAAHPYVLATQADFDRVKQVYSDSSNAYITDRMDYSISAADAFIDAPLLERVFNDDGEMLEVSRNALNRIMTLAGVWQITGDDKYAERCWKEIANVCNFEDWHPEHFLDTAEMSMAVSLGYDWLYNYLSADQRDFIAQTVYDFGIKEANTAKIFSNWWLWSKVNWNTQCYGGIGVACMTFFDRYPKETSKFLSAAYYNMPLHFESFSPDGFYVEGNSYWEAMTSYLLYFVSTSRNFVNTDYGLSDLSGFDKIGYFPVYISAPQGVFNAGDNRNEPLFSPSLHWFATEYNEPMLSYFQTLSDKNNEYARESLLSCVWYDESTAQTAQMPELPLSVYMQSDMSEEFVSMRSAYCDEKATYVGVKGGYNYTNHGDLDIGSFIFDALGERWVMDLGKASYSLPGYFNGLVGGGRWRTYMKRAEGHNTLVINPDSAAEDQYPFAKAGFTDFQSTDDGGSATLDMSDAYIRNGVKSATRTVEMYDGRQNVRITDKIECEGSSDVWWFAHTAAAIDLSDDGKTATLSITDAETGELKQVIVRIADGCNGVFTVMSTLPLSDDDRFDGNKETEGVKKLAIHLENVTSATIIVTFEPVYNS